MSEEKTPEQIKQERLTRYQDNPESFIEIKDVILCATRNEKSAVGISVYIGNCRRSELNNAKSELDHIVHKTMLNMDIQSEMKRTAAQELIKPVGPGNGKFKGMLDFARNRKN